MRLHHPARLLPAFALLALTLGACSHKPLKAPCAREDGELQVLSYAPVPEPSANPLAHLDCGPMKPVSE